MQCGFLLDRAALCLEKWRGSRRRKQSNLRGTADRRGYTSLAKLLRLCRGTAACLGIVEGRVGLGSYLASEDSLQAWAHRSRSNRSCTANSDEAPRSAHSRLCKARRHPCPLQRHGAASCGHDCWKANLSIFAWPEHLVSILPKIHVFGGTCWPWLCRLTSRREHLTQSPCRMSLHVGSREQETNHNTASFYNSTSLLRWVKLWYENRAGQATRACYAEVHARALQHLKPIVDPTCVRVTSTLK